MKKEYFYLGAAVLAAGIWYVISQNKTIPASVTAASSSVYPSGLSENELVKIDSSATVYQLIGGKACPISLSYWSNKLGYAPVTTVTPAQLNAIPEGGYLDYTAPLSASGHYGGKADSFYVKK